MLVPSLIATLAALMHENNQIQKAKQHTAAAGVIREEQEAKEREEFVNRLKLFHADINERIKEIREEQHLLAKKQTEVLETKLFQFQVRLNETFEERESRRKNIERARNSISLVERERLQAEGNREYHEAAERIKVLDEERKVLLNKKFV